MSKVTDLIDRMVSGQITTDQAAREIGSMRLNQGKSSPKTLAAIESAPDGEPMPENSFMEVSSAYARGKISAEQYRALYDAV